MDRGNWEVLRAVGIGISGGCIFASLMIGLPLFAGIFALLMLGYFLLKDKEED